MEDPRDTALRYLKIVADRLDQSPEYDRKLEAKMLRLAMHIIEAGRK